MTIHQADDFEREEFIFHALRGADNDLVADLDRMCACLAPWQPAWAVALENARLYEEARQRAAELAIINSVQAGLASKLDMQAIYELVGEKIRNTFNAQVVSIAFYDRKLPG